MTQTLTRKDYLSDSDVRWCPGCGDYSILNTIAKTFAKSQVSRENTAIVSGIGCSSRFPYYLSTYGFHTLHGRGPTVALGIKVANPEINVWLATGDGDALSIGGNHFIHLMRRNPNINVILFNNEVYGLTKGQTSPTSPVGNVTKSSPFGSVDQPIRPLPLALTSGATFVARAPDNDVKLMGEMFEQAMEHKGISIIEVLQNCPIYNDAIFVKVTDKKQRSTNTFIPIHGEPILFGPENNQGFVSNNLNLEVKTIGEDGFTKENALVFDETNENMAYLLSQLKFPTSPIPYGVLRRVSKPTFEDLLRGQETALVNKKGKGTLKDLYHTGDTWKVS